MNVPYAGSVNCDILGKTAKICRKYLDEYDQHTKKIIIKHHDNLKGIEFLNVQSSLSKYSLLKIKYEKTKEERLINEKEYLKERFKIITLGSNG